MSIIRDLINREARRLNCLKNVADLSEVDAVRFLQKREGYLPCFGRDEPLKPLAVQDLPSRQKPQDPEISCGEADCLWLQPCNAYRHPVISPIDRPGSCRDDIENLTRNVEKFNSVKDSLLSGRSVGVKVSAFENLDSVTKKMLIASPLTVIGESTKDERSLRAYLLSNDVNLSNMSSGPQFYQKLKVLFTSDVDALNSWMTGTQRFLDNGSLAYYPLVEEIQYSISSPSRGDFYRLGSPSIEEWYRRLWQAPPPKLEFETFSAPHIGLPEGDIRLNRAKFVPLLNLDLPVVENADFDVLFKLMSDYPDQLCSFRDFLQSRAEKIRNASLGSERFYEECRSIERDIRDQLRKLKSDMKQSNIQTAFSLTGSVVASFTLAFYCIVQGKGDLLTVLGPGGIAYNLSSAVSKYLRSRIELKDNPAYFLWELGKTE